MRTIHTFQSFLRTFVLFLRAVALGFVCVYYGMELEGAGWKTKPIL